MTDVAALLELPNLFYLFEYDVDYLLLNDNRSLLRVSVERAFFGPRIYVKRAALAYCPL